MTGMTNVSGTINKITSVMSKRGLSSDDLVDVWNNKRPWTPGQLSMVAYLQQWIVVENRILFYCHRVLDKKIRSTAPVGALTNSLPLYCEGLLTPSSLGHVSVPIEERLKPGLVSGSDKPHSVCVVMALPQGGLPGRAAFISGRLPGRGLLIVSTGSDTWESM